jgi:pyruvate dehydrogenase kinase 2/3/4
MRGGGWTSSELIRSSRGLAEGNSSLLHNSSSSKSSLKRDYNPFLATKAMKLKLSGNISREISERRQVGDAEDMFKESRQGDKPWWRNVGLEEGM